MFKVKHITVLILLLLGSFSVSLAQFEEDRGLDISFYAGIGFEYLNRSITWDEGQVSTLKANLFTLKPGVVFRDAIALNAILGYSLASYDSMIFRQLPFSVELDMGNVSGYVLGIELDVFIYNFGDFEIGAQGQFVYYLGMEKEWEISGLAVDGNVTGKPSWQRYYFGPKLTYTGLDYFYPYLLVSYNHLTGKYSLNQVIQDLSGSEEKSISAQGQFCFAAGADYEFMEKFKIRGELSIIPHSENVDIGFLITALYSF